jgi:hypothetical protein
MLLLLVTYKKYIKLSIRKIVFKSMQCVQKVVSYLMTCTAGRTLCLFTKGRTCLFDIIHSALWGSKYPVCMPDTRVLFLSRAHMLHIVVLAVKISAMLSELHLLVFTSTTMICNIPQYIITPVEYRQPKLPSSHQLHHLVLRHLSQVMKNLPCSGFEPGTSRTKVRRSNHYIIELLLGFYRMCKPRSIE